MASARGHNPRPRGPSLGLYSDCVLPAGTRTTWPPSFWPPSFLRLLCSRQHHTTYIVSSSCRVPVEPADSMCLGPGRRVVVELSSFCRGGLRHGKLPRHCVMASSRVILNIQSFDELTSEKSSFTVEAVEFIYCRLCCRARAWHVALLFCMKHSRL